MLMGGQVTTRRDDARYREVEHAVWAHRGLEPKELRVPVEGLDVKIRALVYGEGRPVVFVHGTPSAGAVFVPLVAQLEGIKAIVIDRPGCGLGDPIDYASMSPGRLARTIRSYMTAVVGRLGAGPVDVVGSSAGGMVALTFAAMRPDLVRSVVLEGMPAVRGMRLPLPMRMATLPPVAAAVVKHGFSARNVRQSYRQMGHGNVIRSGAMPQEDVDWRVAVGSASDTFRHELHLLHRAANLQGPRPEWAAGAHTLQTVEAPTLWIIGSKDPFQPRRGIASLAELMRDATVVARPGEGHLPWIDDPAGHAAVITDWWRGLDR